LPELPEAETIARGLDRVLRGRVVESIDVRRRRNVIAPRGVRVEQALVNERIARVGRRGKYVVIFFDSGGCLVVQLRMTGRLLALRPGERPPSSARLVLQLEGGSALAFADVRKLGRVQVVPEKEAWDEALGLEPLGPGFTVEAFAAMLAGRTTPIKVLLLDQRRIAGIGNIYASEALW
jgi:formamidopyrimidine-DNA glycosylase